MIEIYTRDGAEAMRVTVLRNDGDGSRRGYYHVVLRDTEADMVAGVTIYPADAMARAIAYADQLIEAQS